MRFKFPSDKKSDYRGDAHVEFVKPILMAAVVIGVFGFVVGLGAWAVSNVWPVLIIVALGGGGAYLYARNKKAKNAV